MTDPGRQLVLTNKAAAELRPGDEPSAREPDLSRHESPNRRAWRRFSRNRPAVVCGLYLLLVIGGVVIGPWFSPHDPLATSDAQFQPPSLQHWCGTDVHGRDLLARICYGARISLIVGLVGAGVSLVIGVFWGAVAGYVGGRCDDLMMRLVDILYALPSVIFVIVLITTLDGVLNQWSSPRVGVSDLKDPDGLRAALRNPDAPVSRHLVQHFSEPFRSGLSAAKPADEAWQRELVQELNRLIEGPGLLDQTVLEQVTLRGKTARLLRQAPKGEHLVRLNRLVLEDAYPDHIARGETWYTAFGAALFQPRFGATTQMLYLFIGLGAVSWLTMARIVRGQVLSLRTRQFVDASRVLGASHTRIILRHILPNVLGVIIVYLTLTVPSIVLYESFLSYLGLGIKPPQASLGSLIAEGAAQINPIKIYWWMLVCPGALLASTLLALNFLGDGLRDALDPKAA